MSECALVDKNKQKNIFNKKCKHNRSKVFCCTCNYGNTGKHDLSPDEDNPKDLVDEIESTTNYRKLKEYNAGR